MTYQLVHVCAALGHAPCQTEQGLYHAWGILPEAAPGVVADTETAGGNRIVKTASSLLSSGASPSIAAAGDDSNGGEEGSIAAGDDEDEYDGGGEHHNGHAAARNAASNRAASNAGSDKGSNAAVSTAQGNVRPLPMMLSEPQPAMGVLHYFFAAAGGEDAAQVCVFVCVCVSVLLCVSHVQYCAPQNHPPILPSTHPPIDAPSHPLTHPLTPHPLTPHRPTPTHTDGIRLQAQAGSLSAS